MGLEKGVLKSLYRRIFLRLYSFFYSFVGLFSHALSMCPYVPKGVLVVRSMGKVGSKHAVLSAANPQKWRKEHGASWDKVFCFAKLSFRGLLNWFTISWKLRISKGYHRINNCLQNGGSSFSQLAVKSLGGQEVARNAGDFHCAKGYSVSNPFPFGGKGVGVDFNSGLYGGNTPHRVGSNKFPLSAFISFGVC